MRDHKALWYASITIIVWVGVTVASIWYGLRGLIALGAAGMIVSGAASLLGKRWPNSGSYHKGEWSSERINSVIMGIVGVIFMAFLAPERIESVPPGPIVFWALVIGIGLALGFNPERGKRTTVIGTVIFAIGFLFLVIGLWPFR